MNDNSLLDPSLDKQLKGHRSAITALYFNPNEKQIASGSLDNSVLLWDLGGTLRSYRFRGHDEAVTDVTFSPTGKYMATASRDKTVRLWVPTVTGSTGMFKAHSQTVRSVQFSPDGTKLVTASDDKIIKLWATEKYKFLASFVGHTNWVCCARMSNDGSVIASCSDDKTTRLWDPDSGELLHSYKDQKGHGLYVSWHPSGCYIAVATSNGTVKLYDIRTHSLVQYYSVHNEAVTQVAFHPSGSYILTSSKDGKMKILDLLEGHPIFTLTGHIGGVNAVNFSPSGETFASAGEDKLVNLWKTNFTELAIDFKENVVQTPATTMKSTQGSKSIAASKGRSQGTKYWYLCYHSKRYPKANFVTVENDETQDYLCNQTDILDNVFDPPIANSTLNETLDCTETCASMNQNVRSLSHSEKCAYSNIDSDYFRNSSQVTAQQMVSDNSLYSGYNRTRYESSRCYPDCSNDVGHPSHIPRSEAPKPSVYTMPTLNNQSNKSQKTHFCSMASLPEEEDLFGMIKLKHNDICYTSGVIEWVGRKRTYPINSGFKTMNEFPGQCNEPSFKKVKVSDNISDKTYVLELDKTRECDCTNMLPTVNAIVDHLNTLHEAVDIIDLRLDVLERATNHKN